MSHHFFVNKHSILLLYVKSKGINDWKEFADPIGLKAFEAFQISECLFQNNFRNYKWSAEEDMLLRKTIM